MRKLSYADVATDRARLDLRAHVLEIALVEPLGDAIHRHRDGRDTYTWRAYRLAGCAGGYVVCVFASFANRHPTVLHVGTLDAAIELVRQNPGAHADSGLQDAAYRFSQARFEATHAA